MLNLYRGSFIVLRNVAVHIFSWWSFTAGRFIIAKACSYCIPGQMILVDPEYVLVLGGGIQGESKEKLVLHNQLWIVHMPCKRGKGLLVERELFLAEQGKGRERTKAHLTARNKNLYYINILTKINRQISSLALMGRREKSKNFHIVGNNHEMNRSLIPSKWFRSEI